MRERWTERDWCVDKRDSLSLSTSGDKRSGRRVDRGWLGDQLCRPYVRDKRDMLVTRQGSELVVGRV